MRLCNRFVCVSTYASGVTAGGCSISGSVPTTSSGLLATRAGRERALKDIGRLQLVFGGQCPLGLHALLPVDKTYVAVVLRVALWQIGPAADAFPNTSYYPADFRPYPPSIIRLERNSK